MFPQGLFEKEPAMHNAYAGPETFPIASKVFGFCAPNTPNTSEHPDYQLFLFLSIYRLLKNQHHNILTRVFFIHFKLIPSPHLHQALRSHAAMFGRWMQAPGW